MQFVNNKYFALYMGADTLGLMRLFAQLLGYLNLADLGIAAASSYALYKPLAEKDIEQVSIIMNTLKKFYRVISLLILLIGCIFVFLLPHLIKENLFGKSLYIYWSIYVLNLSINYYFARYSILFTADQKYGYVRKIQGSIKTLVLMVQLFALIYYQSYIIYLLIMSLENIISGLMYANKYKKEYSYIISINKIEKNIMTDMRNLFWHKISGLVVFNTDYIILSKFISLEIVAIYSTYMIVNKMIMTVINVLTPVITPNIGKFIGKRNKEEVYQKWRELNALYLFLGTIASIGILLFLRSFIFLWMGQDYLLSDFTMYLILINLFIEIIRIPIGIFKGAAGFFDDYYSSIIEAFINLFVSLILVTKLGLNGVIIGTISSNIIIIMLLKPILVFKRCFRKQAKDYIFYIIPRIFGIIVLIKFNLFFISDFLHGINIYSWTDFITMIFLKWVPLMVLTAIFFLLDSDFRKLVLGFRRKNESNIVK